jgi:asparagine synthase (glutamine-hydrolysing)
VCGIAGAFCQPEGKLLASTMIERISHRGPDACALQEVVRPEYSVALAHARLSIIDLSAAAEQPFA